MTTTTMVVGTWRAATVVTTATNGAHPFALPTKSALRKTEGRPFVSLRSSNSGGATERSGNAVVTLATALIEGPVGHGEKNVGLDPVMRKRRDAHRHRDAARRARIEGVVTHGGTHA